MVITRKGAMRTTSADMMERYGSLIGVDEDPADRKANPEVIAYTSLTAKAVQAPTIPKTRSRAWKPGRRMTLIVFI
jgi:hypothetical protein